MKSPQPGFDFDASAPISEAPRSQPRTVATPEHGHVLAPEQVARAKAILGVCQKTAAAGGPRSPGLEEHYRAIIRCEPRERESERRDLIDRRNAALGGFQAARAEGRYDREALKSLAEAQRKLGALEALP